MRIPADAKTVRDSRVTLVRVITTLYERLVGGDDGLKAGVKATMLEKGASFAESDLVVAALRAGSAKGSIDPRKLHELVVAGTLTLAQFLDCVAVRKEPLKAFLAGGVIDTLTANGPAPEPSLVTEFKEGVELDVEAIAETLVAALARAVPITKA